MGDGRRLRLLLVEANPLDASSLVQLMRTTPEDPIVVRVADLPQAEAHLADHQVDAVFFSEPDPESCRSLVAKVNGAPVIALWRQPEARERALQAGAQLAYAKTPLLAEHTNQVVGDAKAHFRPGGRAFELRKLGRRMFGLG
jgi:DNA-binding NarL/FixJ family response regulator